MTATIKNRYEFVYLFEVENGNPNGDPDAANMPRIDPETGYGLVTDVCLKRKIRNFVDLTKADQPRFQIFVKEGKILNQQIERAYDESDEVKKALAEWKEWQKNKKKAAKPKMHYEDVAKLWMCHNFYDVRTFGAVMSTGDEKAEGEGESKLKKVAGQVRGPVQITFAKSADIIAPLECSMAVIAARTEDKPEQKGLGPRKHVVPYGLYRAEGFVSAFLAEKTGFTDEDLSLLWDALMKMFWNDQSAARSKMAARRLFIFKHEDKLGKAHAHELFKKVSVKLKDQLKAKNQPPRSFDDYDIVGPGDGAQVVPGVTCQVFSS
jgi:CRISPR-associated protein Csd2